MRKCSGSLAAEEIIAQLREKVEYLETHKAIAAGMQGERLVLSCLGGELTSYAAPFDLKLENGIRIEIKRSRLGGPNKGSPNTFRWTWSNPLGSKSYDFLLLVGDRDYRYKSRYWGDGPYVFFLIPKERVPKVVVKSGNKWQIVLTTNLRSVRSERGLIIIDHRVRSSLVDDIERAALKIASVKRIRRTPLVNRKRGGTVKRIYRTPLAKH